MGRSGEQRLTVDPANKTIGPRRSEAQARNKARIGSWAGWVIDGNVGIIRSPLRAIVLPDKRTELATAA